MDRENNDFFSVHYYFTKIAWGTNLQNNRNAFELTNRHIFSTASLANIKLRIGCSCWQKPFQTVFCCIVKYPIKGLQPRHWPDRNPLGPPRDHCGPNPHIRLLMYTSPPLHLVLSFQWYTIPQQGSLHWQSDTRYPDQFPNDPLPQFGSALC